MAWQRSFYQSSQWRKLACLVKRRDHFQCQVCGDRQGDPHGFLHVHHILSRAAGGGDSPENLITLCDLCHAVVTLRWRKPWFGSAAVEHAETLEECAKEYRDFLALPPNERRARQTALWQSFGIKRAA